MYKRCSHCGEEKPFNEFGRSSRGRDGYHYNCKVCAFQQGKESKYRMRYGIELTDKEEMLEQQEGKCGICGRYIIGRVCVDHDHKTGQVREILCNGCNAGLGHFGDNIEILESAIRYLNKWNTI